MSNDDRLANQLLIQAQALDKHDILAPYLDEFLLPEGLIYLDGNSLGPLTKRAKERAVEVVQQQWGNSLIASWNSHNWIGLGQSIGNKIAPLIGASEDTVICCDSISVNLFKLLSAGLLFARNDIANKRTIILSQQDNFPTDLYMAQGLELLLNSAQQTRCELMTVDSEHIEQSLESHGHEIAVLMLTHVNFRSGDIHDMQRITELAHSKGVLVLWDLAHSAGVLPLALEACKVDFALGCTYKYLNGGPGSPGFAYVRKDLLPKLQQPLSGWMGHKKPFDFAHDYHKAPGIEQLLCGTPSIISMSVLDAALDIYEQLNMDDVRAKSIGLNDFFQSCVEAIAADLSDEDRLILACKPVAKQRGSQISYRHTQAYAICQALIAEGVVADFRAPDILRIGFSPLFLRYSDVLNAAVRLCDIMRTKRYQHAKFHVKNAVT